MICPFIPSPDPVRDSWYLAMHVLLVEDDEVLTPIVEAAFREAGHSCEAVDSGKQAVKLAKSNHYDVMVLDVDLPDMDGCQVVRLMKVEGIDTPVVLLSGLADLNLRFVAADLGVEKFLAKPFSASELIGHMETVVGNSARDKPATAPEPEPDPWPIAEPASAPPPDPEPVQASMPAPESTERRRQARATVYGAAVIVDGDSQIPCVILDRSNKGAALLLADPDQPCPTLFTLEPLDGPQCRCEVRWRRGDRIGIEFR
jgi:DNA-binding response OmpR family regulator